MTVNVSKPALNVREKLAELDKPTGIAGEAMLRAETPQEQFNLIGAGRKNLIINGNFDVWQRGTSSSASTSSGYQSADRWYFNASGATYTTAQQTFTLGQTEVPYNPKYFLRFAVTGANDNAGVWQKIEDARRSSGRTVTISFWAKYNSDSPSSTLNLKMFQNFGTGGSPSSQVTVVETFRLYGEWTKYEVQHTYGSVSGKTFGSNDDSFFGIEISNGTNETWDMDLAQVQVEFGKVATPFEQRSYGEELALCQRYYERFNGVSEWLTAHGYGDQIYATIDWKVPKREAAQTVTYSSSTFSDIITAYGNSGASSHIDAIITGVVTSASRTTGLSVRIDLSSNSYTPYGTSVMWRVDAGHWIAYDAEL